jgi:hypothetical protein
MRKIVYALPCGKPATAAFNTQNEGFRGLSAAEPQTLRDFNSATCIGGTASLG